MQMNHGVFVSVLVLVIEPPHVACSRLALCFKCLDELSSMNPVVSATYQPNALASVRPVAAVQQQAQRNVANGGGSCCQVNESSTQPHSAASFFSPMAVETLVLLLRR
jgi:hypothetical protein